MGGSCRLRNRLRASSTYCNATFLLCFGITRSGQYFPVSTMAFGISMHEHVPTGREDKEAAEKRYARMLETYVLTGVVGEALSHQEAAAMAAARDAKLPAANGLDMPGTSVLTPQRLQPNELFPVNRATSHRDPFMPPGMSLEERLIAKALEERAATSRPKEDSWSHAE